MATAYTAAGVPKKLGMLDDDPNAYPQAGGAVSGMVGSPTTTAVAPPPPTQYGTYATGQPGGPPSENPGIPAPGPTSVAPAYGGGALPVTGGNPVLKADTSSWTPTTAPLPPAPTTQATVVPKPYVGPLDDTVNPPPSAAAPPSAVPSWMQNQIAKTGITGAATGQAYEDQPSPANVAAATVTKRMAPVGSAAPADTGALPIPMPPPVMTDTVTPGATPVSLPPPIMAPNITPNADPNRTAPLSGGDGGLTDFTATDNLRGTQINPTQQADTAQARGLISSGLAGLASSPNRQQLGADALQNYINSTEGQYQRQQQDVGRQAAALGRIGSGMTADDVMRLGNSRQQEIVQQSANLANQTAGQELSDRLAQISAAQGAYGDLAGQDLSSRNELRGERGYQNDLANQATDRRVQQATLQDQLLNSQFGRNLNQAQFVRGVAGDYGQQGADQQSAAAQSLQSMALQRALLQQGGGGAGAAPTSPTAPNPLGNEWTGPTDTGGWPGGHAPWETPAWNPGANAPAPLSEGYNNQNPEDPGNPGYDIYGNWLGR